MTNQTKTDLPAFPDYFRQVRSDSPPRKWNTGNAKCDAYMDKKALEGHDWKTVPKWEKDLNGIYTEEFNKWDKTIDDWFYKRFMPRMRAYMDNMQARYQEMEKKIANYESDMSEPDTMFHDFISSPDVTELTLDLADLLPQKRKKSES